LIVTSNPTVGGITNPSGQSWRNSGENVLIAATADNGYYFTGWSGDETDTTNPITAIMNSNKNITANFAIIPYTPTITVSTISLPDFGNVIVGQNSTSKSYTVSAGKLAANIAITAATGFQVSKDNSTFSSSVTLTHSGGSVASTTIYARFSPTSVSTYSGNIAHASEGATTQNVSVSGTGILVQPSTITVSGAVTYANTAATPIGNATVTLTSTTGTTVTATSSATGSYSIANVSPGTYTLTASKTGSWGGVTGGDVQLVAKHAVGISLLTGLPLAAADVNNSGSVTGNDALLMVRRAAGIDNSFPGGDWVFESQQVAVANTPVTANVSGLAMGDVNASYVPGNGTAFAKTVVSLVSESVQDVAPVGTFEVPVRATTEMELGSISLKINYPTNLATFVGVSSKLDGFVYRADEGTVTIVWADISAKNTMHFKANEPLVTLKFSSKADKGTINLTLNSWSELTGSDGVVLSIAKLSAPITKISNVPTVFSLDQNYPNPFNPNTTLRYGLPAQCSVRFIIYNVLGQIVKELINTEQQAGYQSIVWNANVSSGLYFYRLEATSKDDPSKRFIETKKMLLMR
jgi:uncharacterized repeat protein (TIGR02543 family)